MVDLEDALQTALIEPAVVCHKGQSLDERLDLFPDVGEHRSIVRVLRSEAVNLLAEPFVIFNVSSMNYN